MSVLINEEINYWRKQFSSKYLSWPLINFQRLHAVQNICPFICIKMHSYWFYSGYAEKKVKIGTQLDNLNLFTSDITAFWNEMLCSLVNRHPSIRLHSIASHGTAILTLTTREPQNWLFFCTFLYYLWK